MTDHFKGRFPIDIGGLLVPGKDAVQVDDRFGALLVKQNFPRVARCDASGKFLDAVPPVKVEVKVAPKPTEPEQVSLPAAPTAPETDLTDGEMEGSNEDQPTIEPVMESPKGKKKR